MPEMCDERLWSNGDVALCVQDCVGQPLLLGLAVLAAVWRVASMRCSSRVHSHPPPGLNALFGVESALVSAVLGLRAAVLVLDIAVHHHEASSHPLSWDCVLTANICACVAWFISLVLLKVEHGKKRWSGRAVRYWWIAAFLVGTARFRTDVLLAKDHLADTGDHCSSDLCVAVLVVRFVQFGVLLVLALVAVFQRDTPAVGPSPRDESKQPLVDAAPASYGAPGAAEGEGGGSKKASDVLSRASLFEQLTFWWLSPLLRAGFAKPLQFEHLDPVADDDTTLANFLLLDEGWERYGRSREEKRASFFRACSWAFGTYFWVTGLMKVVNDVCVFVGPVLLNRVVKYLENEDEPTWHGYAYAAGMFVATEVQSLAVGQYFFRGFRMGLRVRAAICSLVYDKSLRLTPAARAKFGVGRIVSLMQIDANKICNSIPYLHLTWSAPFQLSVALWLLHGQVGVSAFAGVGVLVLLMPLNAFVARKQAKYTRITMEHRDHRVKLVNEILSGVRVVKMFGWEQSYLERVQEERAKEMAAVRSNSLYGAFSAFLWGATPLLVSVSTFGLYAALGNHLTASTAFTALALFNVLRFPLNALPLAVTLWIDVAVSNKRICEFLVAKEVVEEIIEAPGTPSQPAAAPASPASTPLSPVLPPSSPLSRSRVRATSVNSGAVPVPYTRVMVPAAHDNAVDFVGVTLQYSGEGDATVTVLKDASFSVPPSSLVCVVGAVGSGKSTLLQSMINEVDIAEGTVCVRGRVAYCSQQAWIQNATVKDNILFGSDYDEDRYNAVLRACALAADIAMLPAGEDTEIGERGINLSGGQKQRIALARACYADADVYVLDDVLSAVDVHVGNHIVKECLTTLLRSKTRIIGTHQLQWLSLANNVIMLEGGRIRAQGTYKELTSRGIDFGPLAQQLKDEDDHHHDDEHNTPEQKKPDAPKEKNEKAGKTIKDEDRETGIVALRIWKTYAAALGVFVFVLLGIFYASSQGLQVGSNVWLSLWSADHYDETAGFYLAVYAGLSLGAAALVYVRALTCAVASVNAGIRLHDRVFWAVLRSPVSFFDTTPLGRILNRLSQDQQTVDVQMRMTTQSVFNTLAMLVGAMVTILFATPYVAAIILPVAGMYYYVQRYYRASARELQRLDSTSKSPIFNSFTESLNGTHTIRAFRVESAFAKRNSDRVDLNLSAAIPAFVANRWLAIRLEFLGACIVGFAAVVSVLERSSRGMAAGLAGLALTYALEVTSILNWLIRVFTSSELQMISVERLMEWAKLPPEAALSSLPIPGAPLLPLPPAAPTAPTPTSWPSAGAIELTNVRMRYRPELPLVLKGVSLAVRGGEKVGVVGRTGSGKSSLLVVLFRLTEIEGGTVCIDGVNIHTLALHDLRKNLSIIPQDPTLFSGTLRQNLDPFHDHSDDQLWKALEECSLKAFVESRPEKLALPIEPNGENLSVGQRQLVCLGRALLKRSKILVLDEATASVDGDTDALIQQTLMRSTHGTTVFTIAHRIHTVINYDKILVMDDGKVGEFGAPGELLQNPDGMFYKLVNGTGASSRKGNAAAPNENDSQ